MKQDPKASACLAAFASASERTSCAAVRAPVEPRLIAEWLQDVSAAATFRDRAGVWWRTYASGFLEDLPNQLAARAVPETALEAEQSP
jgi:hypothetical protein